MLDRKYMCCSDAVTSSSITIIPGITDSLCVISIDKPKLRFCKKFPFINKMQRVTLRCVEKRGCYRKF